MTDCQLAHFRKNNESMKCFFVTTCIYIFYKIILLIIISDWLKFIMHSLLWHINSRIAWNRKSAREYTFVTILLFTCYRKYDLLVFDNMQNYGRLTTHVFQLLNVPKCLFLHDFLFVENNLFMTRQLNKEKEVI